MAGMNPPAVKKSRASLAASRKTIQALAVLGTFLIGLRHLMPGESSSGSFDSFCPFGAVETFLPYVVTGNTLRTTNLLNFSIFLGVLGVALVAGRAFCGWMCPLGAVQDFLASLARRFSGEVRHIPGRKSRARFPIQVPPWLDRPLRYVKYGVLALVILASVWTVFPPLHSLCPVRAVFSFKLTPLLWGVLAAFIGSSLLVERGSCRYLCPLGALLAIFNRFSPLHVAAEAGCNHCGRCDVECSMGIQAVPENLRSPECIRCLKCIDTCARPDTLTLRAGPEL